MSDSIPSKRCTKCDRTLPLDAFYIKVKATGRRFSWCKECHCGITNRYHSATKTPTLRQQWEAERAAQRAEAEASKPTTRACRACGETKPLVDFRPRRRTCRACDRAAFDRYRTEHPERIIETQQRHYERHGDERRARARATFRANAEAIARRRHELYLANPGRAKDYVNRHRKRHPGFNAKIVQARRSRKIGVPGRYTVFEWDRIKARQNWTCLMCGRREPDVTLTVDHIVPLNPGWNFASNIQGLCGSCNTRKGRRVLVLRR